MKWKNSLVVLKCKEFRICPCFASKDTLPPIESHGRMHVDWSYFIRQPAMTVHTQLTTQVLVEGINARLAHARSMRTRQLGIKCKLLFLHWIRFCITGFPGTRGHCISWKIPITRCHHWSLSLSATLAVCMISDVDINIHRKTLFIFVNYYFIFVQI